MNILIVGINGFIGGAVATCALLRGDRVFGLSRSEEHAFAPGITYLKGDRTDLVYMTMVIQQHEINVVIDVIAMTPLDSLPLIETIDGLVNQYILLSSCDVYRNYELFQRITQGPPLTTAADEGSALRETRFPYRQAQPRASGAHDRYLDDYDKIPIEHAAMKMSSAWTILRLPMVFGPGDRQHRFKWAIQPMLHQKQRLVVPTAWANWYSTYSYIDNVANAIVLAVGNAAAYNRIFNIGEKQSISQYEWAAQIAAVMDWQGNIVLTDQSEHPFSQSIANLDLSVPFKISSRRIRDELGYVENVAFKDALVRTIESESGELLP